MALDAYEEDIARPTGVPARGGAGGAKLIARIPFLDTTSLVAPAGTGWISARCGGAGGACTTANTIGTDVGGGGAFAREDRPCSAGAAISVAVAKGGLVTQAAPTSISVGGTVICLATSGRSDGPGGQAADCIGTVRSSGGNRGLPGTNGGLANGGSGAAGERNVPDALILGANGRDRGTSTSAIFPGGGTDTQFTNGGALATAPGGDGIAWIEFWTGNPKA